MERASKAIRRGGVRLKSLGGGHSELHMVISEMKDVQQAAKVFTTAQNSAAQDMTSWAADENRAIQDIMSHLAELNNLWTDVQKEFTEHLKNFKHQFEMILDGEKQVDNARAHLAQCEQRELRIRKELKKAAKKATVEEINNLEIKLSQAERAKDLAQLEMMERVHENESVKLIRLKEGLIKVSDAYVEMSSKCAIIFDAQKEISHYVPDVHDRDLNEVKYTGSGSTKLAVIKAREKVLQYRQHNYRLLPCNPSIEDPPPPYTPGLCNPNTGRLYDDEESSRNNQLGNQSTVQRQRAVPSDSLPSSDTSYITCLPLETVRQVSSSCLPTQNSDIQWETENCYPDDLAEALGAAKI
ncbi:uncharacterized protein LOC106461326 isoform X1 [Limulus polyphemus]|uniref:Uncharacterized protein LOC106461326 isoform X1 n=1 Tax=Limulus polyphemus TaxID=6850 RepID=A0ABM1SJU9_LIMPO|nr:uncharacterized protein LOC106461326 isoform X1 [Limulus polyphemus]XP_022243905.1 uncharacterized protein LOC106461326 isoform X1 [Limulus polyphemus]